MTGWKKFLKALATTVPLFLLLINAIIVAVMLFLPTPDYDMVLRFGIGLVVELVWFLIGKTFDDDDTHSKFQSELEDVNKNMRHFNNASVEVLPTYDDFYTRLTKSRLAAREKVQLTQLDPWPPSTYGDEGTRKSYFDGDIAYCKAHPNVNFYRILSIETKEKLEWAKSLIEAMKDLPNVFLAYVKIDSIEKSAPFPKLLSLQIIDKKELFVLNPQYSYMPRSYKSCYYLKNEEVAQIYVDYYERIWDVLCQNGEHGCILKDGKDTEGYEAKLNAIKAERGW